MFPLRYLTKRLWLTPFGAVNYLLAAFCLFTVVNIIVPSVASAQQSSCFLQGRVLDTQGIPIQGAKVVLAKAPTITDSNGYYRINNVAPGSYDLSVIKTGCVFRPGSIRTTVVAGGVTGQECATNSALNNFTGTCRGDGAIYEISGKVFKNDGSTPAPFISVTVSAPALGVNLSVVTDANGQYSAPVTPGTYSVQPSVQSTPANRSIQVTTQDIAGINFTLTTFPTLRTIEGVISKSSGASLPGVLVSAGPGRATFSTTNGSYTLTVPEGTYTVAPVLPGSTFSPSSSSVAVSSSNRTGINFTQISSPAVYSISGTVRNESRGGIANITVRLSNGSEVVTDSSGAYSFTLLSLGTYTVQLVVPSDKFVSPLSRTAQLNGGSLSNIDFFLLSKAAPSYPIFGQVRFSDGTPVDAVRITSTNWSLGVFTDAGGFYSTRAFTNGSYVVSATRIGYSFQRQCPTDPSGATIVNNAPVNDCDFIATCSPGYTRIADRCFLIGQTFSVSGKITSANGFNVAGITVGANGVKTVTNTDGTYTIAGLSPGSYTVSPELPAGATSAPQNVLVQLLSGDVTGINFTLSGPGYTTFKLSGAVTFGDGTPTTGIPVSTGANTTTTDLLGNYTFSGLGNGSYTISSVLTGYVITPLFTNPVVVNNGDVANLNFTATCATGFTRSGGACVPNGTTPKFSISGTVRFSDSTPVGGVSVFLDTVSTSTGGFGQFTFSDVTNGSYTLSGAQSGYVFTPAFSNPVIVNGANIVNRDFTATCASGFTRSGAVCIPNGTTPKFSISGAIRFSDLTPVSGVTVFLNGVSTSTGISGLFSFSDVANGSYLLSGAQSGYVFTPTFTNPVIVSGASITNRDFIASCAAGFTRSGTVCIPVVTPPTYSISGAVRFSDGTPIEGIAIRLNNSALLTNTVGAYTFSGLSTGSYQLSAEQTGYILTPNFSSPVVVNNANLVDRNFTAICAPQFTRSGTRCIPSEPSTDKIVLSASDDASTTDVVVEWSPLINPRRYVLYRSDFSGAIGSILASDLTTTRYLDTSAVPGVTYFYTVIGISTSGVEVVSNQDGGRRKSDGLGDSTKLRSPVFAKYNTFLRQLNYLELISAGTTPIVGTVTVYSSNGVVVSTRPVTIPAGTQIDLDINKAVNRSDTYGLVRVDFNDTSSGVDLQGRISNYRKNPKRSDYSFAFSRELRNPTRGVTYALANTIDPLGKRNKVPNWGEIINLSPTRWLKFTQRVYDRDGKLVRTFNVDVPPLGERDSACGVDKVRGEYLCEFIPEDGAALYLSSVARYSENSINRRPAETYNFAFALEGRQGNSDSLFAPIRNQRGRCWSEQNFVEVANVREIPVTATVSLRSSNGLLLKNSPVTVVLQPKAQTALNSSALLPVNEVGSVEVRGDKPGAIVAQSMFYYYDCRTNLAQSAYSSDLRRPGEAVQVGTFNTNLGMRNALNVVSVSPSPVDLDLTFTYRLPSRDDVIIVTPGATRVDSQDSVQLSLSSGIYSRDANTYGAVTINSGVRNSFIAEVVRIREDSQGRIDFISTTRVR